MLKLKQVRESKGMTQMELSERSGITQKSISLWEDGSGNPTIKNLAKVAQVLQVGLEELLGNQDTTKPIVSPMDRLINTLHKLSRQAQQQPDGVEVLQAEMGSIHLCRGIEQVAKQYGQTIERRPLLTETMGEWVSLEIRVRGIRISEFRRKEEDEAL